MRNSAADFAHLQVALWLVLGVNSAASGQGVPQPITGQCLGHESQPGCVLPNLFGPTGLTVGPPEHNHHFASSAQTLLNQSLSTAIATQLAIQPIISPASGFTYKYDSTAGAFVRNTNSFGPIYTERAETVGRGKLSFGASYQRFRFDQLDGIDLKKIPVVLKHIPVTTRYTDDVIKTTNDVSLHMDQTMLFGTIGITDGLDLSVAVPIVSVRMGVISNANLITVPVSGDPEVPGDPHKLAPNEYTSEGSASGIGDVTVRVKANVLRSEAVRVALSLDVRTPSGDARRLLGSGSTGIKPFLAISAGKRFSPHVNVGYQWNSRSILAGDVTGTSFPQDSTGKVSVQNGPAVNGHMPSQFSYSLGADIGVTKRLTLAFDYLGQTVFKAPRVFTTFAPDPSNNKAVSLPDIMGVKRTTTLYSGAAGLKYNLFGGLLLTADLLFRMDNNGLRQDVTPLIAISRAFGN